MWLFGNYGRLSKDEKGEKEDSKDTQLNYNAQYIKDNELGVIVDNYFDDDISGVTFDREDLDRIKDDLEKGKINAVVAKDLSRLGRNNAKTLMFLDWLQERNYRLIVINDKYDSTKDDDDIIGIKTWFNERYVKDISVKIRSNIHQKLKEGQYLGTPPYGYKKEYKTINNKLKPINILLIDEKVAFVIVEIFDLYINGYGYRNVANIMTEKGYINPSQYKNYNRPQSPRWNKDHIKRIINNRVYCGDTIQGKREKISYKSKKTQSRPEEKWYIKENTHEPIINRDKWLLANEINKKRGKEQVRNKISVHLFSSFLKCGSCGKTLCFRHKKDRNEKYSGYVCWSYVQYGKGINGCLSHYINEKELENIIIERIIYQLSEEKKRKGIDKHILEMNTKKKSKISSDSLKKEIIKLEKQLKMTYQDRLDEIITPNQYSNIAKEINQKIENYQKQIVLTENTANLVEQELKNKEKLLEAFNEIVQNKKLTRELLEKCIEKIYVFMPGDITDENKDLIMKKLNTTIEIVNELQCNGGIHVLYKYSNPY